MSKIITVLNQKGETGKTIIATNIAHALQLEGHIEVKYKYSFT